ncbi:hypothetical protein [Streptomyces solicathayae]|uniref:DUF4288 domain-containing protein n=1 Tax=Streptomyces solicathayae TaxID=3081768 RepID=A0ABZ0LQ45_9ACTN|nr:hypothetical protein [Streptomyces sp. HUAS YS2]WOX21440.1 hypothetical protein R2D22_08550 [Streptomyces sp. HUAS YS2]
MDLLYGDHGGNARGYGRPAMKREPKAWYGVRTFYRWLDWENRPYEERVVLFRAWSLEEAIEVAERESTEYARESGFEVLDMVQAYRISDADEEVGAGTEVFSKLHALDLPANEFLDRYDSGHGAH